MAGARCGGDLAALEAPPGALPRGPADLERSPRGGVAFSAPSSPAASPRRRSRSTRATPRQTRQEPRQTRQCQRERACGPHTPVEHRLARWRGYRSGSGSASSTSSRRRGLSAAALEQPVSVVARPTTGETATPASPRPGTTRLTRPWTPWLGGRRYTEEATWTWTATSYSSSSATSSACACACARPDR